MTTPDPPTDEAEEPSEPTALGLDPHVEAAGAYALWFLSGILLLVIERDNRFVRFHAMQSTVTFATCAVTYAWVLPLLPLAPLLRFVAAVGIGVLWVHLILRAWAGEHYKLPGAGEISEDLLNRVAGL